MRTKEQANVSLLPALSGLFFLVFGRISYRFWGFLLFSISLVLLTSYGYQITPVFQRDFSRLDSLHLPVSIQTTQSPLSKTLTEEQLLEAEGLVKTPQGILPFSKKLTVYSTSYDKNCLGCSETTATGLKTGFGVVAVDPKVIPLGTKLFIPGYGIATAGDTGGNIKGAKVDLGFDDVRNGWWSARFVEIYILK
ncbi:3D domain-containing protein [Patescibacteria group bacterium]|nr:3D domain-containing protein [Patescibacteria group bacterium]